MLGGPSFAKFARMAETWAITGVTGYVGRALRASLEADGIAVRGLGRSEGAEVRGDVRDRDALAALIEGADVVVHLAAYVHRSARGRAAECECRSVNVDGMQALLDAMQAAKSSAFAVFVSSASVYGPGSAAFDESAACSPVTAYGRSKLEAEGRFLAAVRAGTIRGCVLRPAMIFGPGAPGNLALLAAMVAHGLVVEVAHGEQRKSIVPVSHAVAAIRAVAAHRDACNGEIVNVAGETLTMHEIIEALARGGERSPRILSVPRWLAAALAFLSTKARTYMTSATLDGTKLRALTGCDPPERAAAALERVAAK